MTNCFSRNSFLVCSNFVGWSVNIWQPPVAMEKCAFPNWLNSICWRLLWDQLLSPQHAGLEIGQ